MHLSRLALATVIASAACGESAPSPLLNPHPDSLAQQAPDSFRVEFTTSK